MGTPHDYLPKQYSDEEIRSFLRSISFLSPIKIQPLTTGGEFHMIYVLAYDIQDLSRWLSDRGTTFDLEGRSELILRVAGNHIALIKTENEAAVLHWLTSNTTIPVPRVIKFDSTEYNLLGREYMIMTREPGQCLADVYQNFTDHQMDSILRDILDAQKQLHSRSWSHIGGLKFDGANVVVPGPVLEEDMWFIPDIEKYWPGETYETLNLCAPVHSYVEYITAHMRNYTHCIATHPSLESMRDLLPQISEFLTVIAAKADQLNDIPLRLAHKDLHFGNILVDTETARVTCILDWEMAGSVPFTMWDPHNAFLAVPSAPGVKDKDVRERFRQRYRRMVNDQSLNYLLDNAKFTSKLQHDMQEVQTYCRSIVEVCPRGQRQDLVPSWRQIMSKAMASFIA